MNGTQSSETQGSEIHFADQFPGDTGSALRDAGSALRNAVALPVVRESNVCRRSAFRRWRSWNLALAALVGACAFAGGFSGCSGNDGASEGETQGPSVIRLARIVLTPVETTVSLATPVNQPSSYSVVVRSEGALALQVDGIWLEYESVTPDELEPAFELLQVRGCKLAGCPDPTIYDAKNNSTKDLKASLGSALVVDPSDASQFAFLEVIVNFKRPPTAADREATLVVQSNADGQREASAKLRANVGKARLAVAPLVVDFGIVKAGESLPRIIGLNNEGTDELVIDRVEFQGSNYFRLLVDDDEYAPGGSVNFDPVIAIAAAQNRTVSVVFTPLDGLPSTGTIRVFSNDPQAPPNGVLVELRGNTSGPCIALNPSTTLAFGPKPIGNLTTLPVQVINCGNAPLEVYDIALKDGSSPDFGLDFSSLPGFTTVQGPTDDEPLVIGINQLVDLTVTFVPDGVNPTDGAGLTIPDIGWIVFRNNTFDQFRELELRGVGIDELCPKAVIFVVEGEEVIPQTTLNLKGDQSMAVGNATITGWNWTVEQPAGSASTFLPLPTVSNPQFEVNVAGIYRFELMVTDSGGNESCEPARADVAVIPDQAIHVELVWDTPNDPDPTDTGLGKGSDLDLHFAHPFADMNIDVDGDGYNDPWFDPVFDCFWYNRSPDWEELNNPADDPSLDRDDTDGAGPENLNLDMPYDGRIYRIGVHYWNDHGFGSSLATLRVYFYSELVWEGADVLINKHDLWDAATVEWPSGSITPILDQAQQPRIVPNYINPQFPQP